MARSGSGMRPSNTGIDPSVTIASPGGFDLLDHIYRMPIALNFHPAISPDGKQIAFMSDRNGRAQIN